MRVNSLADAAAFLNLLLVANWGPPRENAGADRTVGTTHNEEADNAAITTVTLIIEVMGRYSNIVLVDGNGVVMEAVKHISAEINRYRVTLPRHPYVLPPSQDKADPRAVSAMSLAHLLTRGGDRPTWQMLVQAYRGISPLLAREMVFRVTGTTDAPCAQTAAEPLADTMAALLALPHTHQWSPSFARENDAILDFAPYHLMQFGERTVPAPTISSAIQAYYEQETVASDYAGLKREVQKALNAQRDRVMRRKQSLQQQQAIGEEAESLRTKGELLLAYATQINPRQKEVHLAVSPDQPPLRITLDPQLSVIENAQAYFKRYAQARDAARLIPLLLAQAEADLAYLDQLELDLALAKTADEMREVRRALAELGVEGTEVTAKQRRPGKAGKLSPPLTFTSADGMEIVVGRNAHQNDHVTFELAAPSDLWLHARGVAGSHVIVRSSGRPVSRQTIEQAAALAAAYSAARNSTSIAVDYTERRNVRRMKGGGPGLVTYSGEKTIHVRPAPEN